MKIGERARGFFFAEESVRGLRVYRVLLGLWTALLVLERLPYADEVYGLPVLRVGLIAAAPPLVAVYAATAVLLAAAVAIAAGWRVRAATVAVFVCLGWLAAVEVRPPRAYVVLALCQWFLLLGAPVGRAGAAPRWATQLIRMQFAATYAFAALGKLLAPPWWSGEAVRVTLRAPHYGQFMLSSWFALDEGPWPWSIAWGTIAGEFFVAVGLWLRATRRAAVAAVVLLHLGIAGTLRVSWLFHGLMLVHLVLFVRIGERQSRGSGVGAGFRAV